MFRQSIDPKGSFPPKSSKTPPKKKKGKKKPKIKRRRRTKDRFATERKQEQVFRFGERRSGLSGRTLNKPEGTREPRQPAPRRNDNRDNFNPGDYLRIHNQSIKNQLRDQAEKKSTGGTFTGTSIGEEKRVREAQEVDKLFKKQEAETRERFVGALESFVKKIPTERTSKGDFDKLLGLPPRKKEEPIRLPDREIVEALGDIKEEIKKAKVIQVKKPKEEFGIADIEEIASPIPEHRKPEEDITFLALDRSERTSTPFGTAPPQGRPRPNPSNPSLTKSIPTQSVFDTRGREEIEKLRRMSVEPTQERRQLFLEEQEDTTEYLTPTGRTPPTTEEEEEETISLDKPTEIPIIAPPLTTGKPLEPGEEIVKIAEKVREEKKAKEEKAKVKVEKKEEELLNRLSDNPEAISKRPAEVIKTEARLEAYQELADFSSKQKGIPKNFDNLDQHYRLQVIEDVSAKELGRQERVGGLAKGEQFRLQRTDYKDQAIANRGFYFYRDNKGKQLTPKQENLFKINLANPKVNTRWKEAITNGKIKISLDVFDDEI